MLWRPFEAGVCVSARAAFRACACAEVVPCGVFRAPLALCLGAFFVLSLFFVRSVIILFRRVLVVFELCVCLVLYICCQACVLLLGYSFHVLNVYNSARHLVLLLVILQKLSAL